MSSAAQLVPKDASVSADAASPQGGGAAGGGDGSLRESLGRAKMKCRVIEVWWASIGTAEQQTSLAGLEFALRVETGRREELRRAAEPATVATPLSGEAGPAGGTAAPRKPPAAPVDARRLIQEL